MPDAADRWQETWALLERPAPGELLAALTASYGEPHRRYHDLRHVLDCLAEAAGCRGLQESPARVDLALWYHDVVYDPRRSDNEARSADFAVAELAGLVPEGWLPVVAELILDTRHDRPPSTPDGAVVVDVDLSILGRDPERYEEYRQAIRAEYSWVPAPLYRRRRAGVLRSFLDRPAIYSTATFRERYEAQARANLSAELDRLG